MYHDTIISSWMNITGRQQKKVAHEKMQGNNFPHGENYEAIPRMSFSNAGLSICVIVHEFVWRYFSRKPAKYSLGYGNLPPVSLTNERCRRSVSFHSWNVPMSCCLNAWITLRLFWTSSTYEFQLVPQTHIRLLKNCLSRSSVHPSGSISCLFLRIASSSTR